MAKCENCGAPLDAKEGSRVAVCKYCGTKQTLKDEIESSPTVKSLLKRAANFLEDGDFENADEYFDRVLDIEPENARAYLGKLTAELRVQDLDTYDGHIALGFVRLERNRNYTRALQFADDELKAALENYRAISFKQCMKGYASLLLLGLTLPVVMAAIACFFGTKWLRLDMWQYFLQFTLFAGIGVTLGSFMSKALGDNTAAGQAAFAICYLLSPIACLIYLIGTGR